MHPLITLQEHYQASPLADLPHNAVHISSFPQTLKDKLRDLGPQLIADMDAGSVSLQVISHAPAIGNASQCRSANETLAAAVNDNPTRFAGFATLPIGEPEKAAKELEYCVKELGFVGALIDNHLEGRFYDDEAFWPVFDMAEKLGTVLYIHPAFPSDDRDPLYKGNYPTAVENRWEGGGSDGIWRQVCTSFVYSQQVTTSRIFSLNPLACLLRNTKVERVLYSVDYLFSCNEEGLEFVGQLRGSGMVSQEGFERICWRNAEELLGVKAK